MCLSTQWDLLEDEQIVPKKQLKDAVNYMTKITNLKLHMHLELISKVRYFSDIPPAIQEEDAEIEVQVGGYFPSFPINVNSDSLDKVNENLEKVSYLLQDKLPSSYERNEFANSFSKLSDSFTEISRNSSPERISTAIQDLAVPYTSYLGKLGELTAMTLLGTLLIRALYTDNKILLGFCSITLFLLSFMFPNGVLASFYSTVKSVFFSKLNAFQEEEIVMEECDAEPQIGVEEFSSGIGLGLSSILLYYSGGEVKNLPKDIYEKLNSFGRIKNSVKDITNLGISLFSDTINYVLKNILGMEQISFFRSNIEAVDAYYLRAGRVLDEHTSEAVVMTMSNAHIVHDLVKEGEMLLRKIPPQLEFNTVRQMLRERLQKISILNNKYLGSKFSIQGARVETVGVMIRGGPGSYKSIAMERLAYSICALYIENDAEYNDFLANPAPYLYNRQPETVYFDGYTPKVIVLYIDDFGQAVEVAGNPDNESFSIVRMINGFQTNLHMSRIEDKANSVFVSPFAFFTTNQKIFRPASMVSSEALLRRFTVDVVCTVKDEYAMDNLDKTDYWQKKADPAKLPIDPETGLSMITADINEFFFCNEEGVPFGTPFSFDQLVRITFSEHKKRVGWHSKHRTEFLNVAANYREHKGTYASGISEQLLIQKSCLDKLRCSGNAKKDFANDVLKESIRKGIETSNTNGFVNYIPIQNGDIESPSSSFYDYEQKGPNRTKSNFSSICSRTLAAFMARPEIIIITKYIEYMETNPFLVGMMIYFICSFAVNSVSYLFSKIYSMFSGEDIGPEIEVQSFGFSDKMRKPTSKQKNKMTAKDFLHSLRVKESQHGDTSGSQIVDSFTYKNVWRIHYILDGKDINIGYAINLVGDRVVMPGHFITYFLNRAQEDIDFLHTVIYFKKYGNGASYDTTVRYILENHYQNYLLELDACVLVLPSHFPKSTNNLSKFALFKDHDHSHLNLDFVLSVPHDKGAKQYCGKAVKSQMQIRLGSKYVEPYLLPHSYMYDASTVKGDCGAPFYIMNSRIPARKIFGFHIAGVTSDGRGYSTILFQEVLEKELADIPSNNIILKEEFPVEHKVIETQNGMHCLGSISPIPNKILTSDYMRSKLHNKVFPSTKMLAQLSPIIIDGKKIDVLEKANTKYCPQMKPLILHEWESLSYEFYSWMISKGKKQFQPRILTLEEALDGVENTIYYSKLNPKSGGGYPMNCSGVRDLKTLYVQSLPDSTARKTLIEEIRILVENVIEDARNGIRNNWIFTDCSKDEKISPEKLKLLKTRMFSGGNFIYVLVWRMYNGSFDMFFNANDIDIGMSAGLNPNSQDWERLGRELNRFGSQHNKEDCMVGAGDHSGFDTRHHPGVLKIASDITNMWYADSEENHRIRDVLNLEIYNSQHLNGSLLYSWNGSLPSGHPATFRINSFVNVLAFMHCWYQNISDYFFDNVAIVVGGDDVIFSVSDTHKNLFNEMTLPSYMGNIGYVYTTETKGDASFQFRKLNEVEFLKRSFRVNESNILFAPLRYEVCLETCQWTKKKDTLNIVVSNTIASLDEISIWYNSRNPIEKERALRDYNKLLKEFKIYYPFVTLPTDFNLPIEVRMRKALVQIHFF